MHRFELPKNQWQYLGLLWMLGPFLPWRRILDVNNFKIIESLSIDFHLTLPNRETERIEKERTWKDIWRVGFPETNITALEVTWTKSPHPVWLMTVKAPGLCRQWFWWDFSSIDFFVLVIFNPKLLSCYRGGSSHNRNVAKNWEWFPMGGSPNWNRLRNTLRWLILSKSFPYNFKVTII